MTPPSARVQERAREAASEAGLLAPESEPPARGAPVQRLRTLKVAAFLAGGLAAPFVTLPLDVIRTRLQASDGVILSQQAGSLRGTARALLAEVAASRSAAPLFAGLRPAMLGSSIHFCVLMLLYEPLRDGARERWRAAPHLLPDVAAGALAGAAAVVVTNPLWVLKTRLQTARPPPGGGAHAALATGAAAAALSSARALVASEGPRVLMRGVAPALLLVSYNALQLPLYHAARAEAGLPTFPSVVLSVTAASLATYPLQVIRTRFQAERVPSAAGGGRRYGTFGAVLRHAAGDERGGARAALYRGITPHLLRSVLGWYVRFGVAETLLQLAGEA